MSKAKTPAIKAILKARQDSQFEMMKEVVEISETVKRGLVRKIKDDVNKIWMINILIYLELTHLKLIGWSITHCFP